MNQRCLKEFKVKYTKKENMGGQRLISIFSVRSGSEALAVSLEENYCSHFYRQEQLGVLLYLECSGAIFSRKAIRNRMYGCEYRSPLMALQENLIT